MDKEKPPLIEAIIRDNFLNFGDDEEGEKDERVKYLKARLKEEKEFYCIKCRKAYCVAGRSLWAPYICSECSPDK